VGGVGQPRRAYLDCKTQDLDSKSVKSAVVGGGDVMSKHRIIGEKSHKINTENKEQHGQITKNKQGMFPANRLLEAMDKEVLLIAFYIRLRLSFLSLSLNIACMNLKT
jgi:hypothetical protein